MTQHPLIIGILLGGAVAIAILCAIGLAIMRDAYQRLHFPTPVVSLSALFIIVAVFLEDNDASSRVKMVIIVLIMFVMNGVLSHATARAVRIKNVGRWPVDLKEKIPLHDTDSLAGTPQPAEDAK